MHVAFNSSVGTVSVDEGFVNLLQDRARECGNARSLSWGSADATPSASRHRGG